MPRRVIDPGPFRFKEIHGPHRTIDQVQHVVTLLKLRGHRAVQSRFQLQEVAVIDLIESLIVEAHVDRGLQEMWDYEAWRAKGAPEVELRAIFARIDEGRRRETPKHTPLLNELESLYARGAAVEPLVAVERDFDMSSGDKALIIVDGRHRVFAAARAATDRLPVFVLL